MTSSPPTPPEPRSGRIDFIDAQRGIAVALMIWMHSADGWLRPALKHGAMWETVRSLGGLAAPAFFFLAGLGLGLDWGKQPPDRARLTAQIARGLQLVVLGYALRVQMWMLDAGGISRPTAWAAAIPLALGYYALYRALGLRAAGDPGGRRHAVAGVACVAVGLALVAWLVPGRFRPLLRVDVLQGLGASLAIVTWLGAWMLRRRLAFVALGVCVALATPWLRNHVPGPLPAAIAGYLAVWEVGSGVSAPTLFPLFPWLAYVPLGVVFGLSLAPLDAAAARRRTLRWAVGGCGLALLCCEPLPPAKAILGDAPWLLQGVRVGYRLGVVLILGAVGVAFSAPRGWFSAGWVALGRASLLVYWVHLELTFGTLSRPIARQLAFPAWFVGFVALLAAMAALAHSWVGLRRRLQPGSPRLAPGPGPATA